MNKVVNCRNKSSCALVYTLIAISLYIFFFPPAYAYSREYYVSSAGNNANPGTQSLPWKTISKAANTLIAGDTVYIGSGIYQERLIPAYSGSAGKYIHFTAQSGASVTLDGSSISLPVYDSGLVHIEGKRYIKISGLTIQNARPYPNNSGIYIDSSDHIIIEENKTYNTVSSGIGVWSSSNISITSNEVELACNDGEQECITIAGTTGFEVRNNHVHHNGPGTNGGEGIDVKDGSSNGKIYNNYVHDLSRLGIYVDAWDKHTHTIEISGNRIHSCQNDGITLASEMGGLLENITVTNNIVYRNRYNGISITPNGDVAQPPMRNLLVINNTFHNNGDKSTGNPWGGGILVENPNIQTLVIRNNIFSQNLFFQILQDVPVVGLNVDHNLIFGFRNYENEIKGSAVIEGNPNFVSISSASEDFHLHPSSPAIDKGSSVNAPVEDFESSRRPFGSGFDIGAYEYASKAYPGTFFLLLNTP